MPRWRWRWQLRASWCWFRMFVAVIGDGGVGIDVAEGDDFIGEW